MQAIAQEAIASWGEVALEDVAQGTIASGDRGSTWWLLCFAQQPPRSELMIALAIPSAIGVGSQRSEFKRVQLCFGFAVKFAVFRSLLHRAIENFRGWTLQLLAILGDSVWFSHGFPM